MKVPKLSDANFVSLTRCSLLHTLLNCSYTGNDLRCIRCLLSTCCKRLTVYEGRPMFGPQIKYCCHLSTCFGRLTIHSMNFIQVEVSTPMKNISICHLLAVSCCGSWISQKPTVLTTAVTTSTRGAGTCTGWRVRGAVYFLLDGTLHIVTHSF